MGVAARWEADEGRDRGTRPSTSSTGETVFSGGALNAPLGLTVAPDGDIVVVNGNDGKILEITPTGNQIATMDTGFGAGALFGLAIAPGHSGIYLVNDGDNTLQLLD
jgi:DNA-binding beta-propeller fold protein YncE